jgi:ribosome-binding ATPase YchF (GTP1/OBG family)
MQSANTAIPEPRVEQLCSIYKPKKVTFASIELVDTPGLSRSGDGNPARLAQLREADALVVVAAGFDNADPAREINAFREDLLLADLEIVTNRLERISETNKRPVSKQQHESLEFEKDVLEKVQAGLEAGKPVATDEFTDEQLKVTRAFRLMNEKPYMIIVNASDDEADLTRFASLAPPNIPLVTVAARLELELAKMNVDERTAFLDEMGLKASSRDGLLRMIMDVSQQMLFLTAGEKEVRTWLVRKNGTAVEAAGEIHTDMAKGFIRAEVTRCDDLVRLGSERAVKAENLVRREPKDYVIQEGDVLLFHFSS